MDSSIKEGSIHTIYVCIERISPPRNNRPVELGVAFFLAVDRTHGGQAFVKFNLYDPEEGPAGLLEMYEVDEQDVPKTTSAEIIVRRELTPQNMKNINFQQGFAEFIFGDGGEGSRYWHLLFMYYLERNEYVSRGSAPFLFRQLVTDLIPDNHPYGAVPEIRSSHFETVETELLMEALWLHMTRNLRSSWVLDGDPRVTEHMMERVGQSARRFGMEYFDRTEDWWAAALLLQQV